MNICILSLGVILSALTANTAWAGCKQSQSVRSAAPIVINLTTPLSGATTYSGSFRTSYPGEFTCDIRPALHRNHIGNASVFTANKPLGISLNNAKDFLSFKVINVDPSDVAFSEEFGGTYPASRVDANFVITVDLLKSKPGGNVMTSPNNTYTVPNAVMAQDMTDHTWSWMLLQWASDLVSFIFTGRWPVHDYDIYYQPITLIFNRQATTCVFANQGLTVTLPAANLADLKRSGDAGYKNFNLNFQCDYLTDGKANRTIRTYLSSNSRLATDGTVLVGDASSSAKGIGIRVTKNGENTPLLFAATSSTSITSTLLFSKETNDALETNFSLPMTAYYHLYDRANAQSGSINTTAILNFEYD